MCGQTSPNTSVFLLRAWLKSASEKERNCLFTDQGKHRYISGWMLGNLNFQAFEPWVCPHPKAGPGNDRSFDMWRRTSHGLMSLVCRSLRPPPFRGFKGKPNGRRNCGVPSEKTCPSSRAGRVISDLILPDRAAMLLPAK